MKLHKRGQNRKKRLLGMAIGLPAAALVMLAGQFPVMKPDYPIQAVGYTKVKLADELWAPRIETNRRRRPSLTFSR